MPRKKIIAVPAVESPASISLAPRGLRYAEAAAYLGSTISYVRSLVWTGKLPAIRMGKRDILLREDLDKYLSEARKAA